MWRVRPWSHKCCVGWWVWLAEQGIFSLKSNIFSHCSCWELMFIFSLNWVWLTCFCSSKICQVHLKPEQNVQFRQLNRAQDVALCAAVEPKLSDLYVSALLLSSQWHLESTSSERLVCWQDRLFVQVGELATSSFHFFVLLDSFSVHSCLQYFKQLAHFSVYSIFNALRLFFTFFFFYPSVNFIYFFLFR